MGRRGYNQVCLIFLLRLKLDCKCCFNVFKKIIFFFLCLYFVTGRITIIACVYLLVKMSRTSTLGGVDISHNIVAFENLKSIRITQ